MTSCCVMSSDQVCMPSGSLSLYRCFPFIQDFNNNSQELTASARNSSNIPLPLLKNTSLHKITEVLALARLHCHHVRNHGCQGGCEIHVIPEASPQNGICTCGNEACRNVNSWRGAGEPSDVSSFVAILF